MEGIPGDVVAERKLNKDGVAGITSIARLEEIECGLGVAKIAAPNIAKRRDFRIAPARIQIPVSLRTG